MPGLILPYRGVLPHLSPGVFVAPSASVIGDVEIGEDTNIWFSVVVRGDVNVVRIGARTNLQDGTVVHVDAYKYGCFIGNDVTIGHAAVVHACTVEDRCFIGMQATIMDGAVIESGAMIAAGALVTPGKRVTGGKLWAGVPAKPVRPVNAREQEMIDVVPGHYVDLAREYLDAGV
jgi:carbonic anhydrase/acetyltransferase-like protein (isoleucine patch superfamily)